MVEAAITNAISKPGLEKLCSTEAVETEIDKQMLASTGSCSCTLV